MEAGSLPSWLLILRGPSWTRFCNSIPSWPHLYDEIWTSDPLWRREKVQRALGVMRQQWHRTLNRMIADLNKTDWTHVPSADLVVLLESGWYVQVGVTWLLPTPKAVGDLDRLSWFYETLLRKGCMDYRSDKTLKHPLQLAVNCAMAQLVGNYAWREVLRRGEQHKPGFAAALLLWCMTMARQGIGGRAREQTADNAATFLKNVTLKRSLPRVQEIRENVDSQVVETLTRRWGDIDTFDLDKLAACAASPSETWGNLDVFEVLSRALDGKLNIAPRAIADDLQDHFKRVRRYVPVGGDGSPVDSDEEDQEPRRQQPPMGSNANTWTPLDDAISREHLEAIQADPKLTQLVKAAVENPDATQEALAEALGVTDRTIRNWVTQLKATLADY